MHKLKIEIITAKKIIISHSFQLYGALFTTTIIKRERITLWLNGF